MKRKKEEHESEIKVENFFFQTQYFYPQK